MRHDGIAHAHHTVGRISRWRCSDGLALTTRILQCPSHFPNRVCLDVRKDSEPNKSIPQEIMNQLHHRHAASQNDDKKGAKCGPIPREAVEAGWH